MRAARMSALPARSSRQASASSALLYATVGLDWAKLPGSSESLTLMAQLFELAVYGAPQMSVLAMRVSRSPLEAR